MSSAIKTKFFFAKGQKVAFSEEIETVGRITFRTASFNAGICSTGNPNHFSVQDCKNFCDAMERKCARELSSVKALPSPGESKEAGIKPEPLSWNLQVKVGIHAPRNLDECIVKLVGNSSGNCFEKLHSVAKFHGFDTLITVQFRNIGYVYTGPTEYRSPTAATKKSLPSIVMDDKTYGVEMKGIVTANSQGIDYWQQRPPAYSKYSGEMDVIVTLMKKVSVNINSSIFSYIGTDVNSIILDTEKASDLSIIPANGSPVKCHKNFLFAHSSVFEAMFQEGFEESKTNTIEMPDMTEASVKAFLRYLYLKETKEALDLSVTAFELLQAGHKYAIKDLEEIMKEILLSKSDAWYDVDVAMRLYLFAKKIEGGEKLKLKAVKLIKLNHAVLKTSASFCQLFKEEPEGAMELYQSTFLV